MKRTIFLLFLLISCSKLASQPLIDTRGDDFWITFIPNYHNIESPGYDKSYYTDTLYIFVVANEPCTGKIDYRDDKGLPYSQNFTINDPSQIYVFKVPYELYELRGFNKSGKILGYDQNEMIAKQSFHITTSKDVTIYAHSQAITTSESMTALPTDALGMEYLILTYNSDGSYDPRERTISEQSTPSQFAIIATEDNTNVAIEPSVPTRVNKSQIQNFTLNQGDVYLVQADIALNQYRNDLTGTKVTSDKPIAVIAGHQRATLPVNGVGGSRDMLMEQLPPLNAWGRNSIVVPFAQSSTITNTIDNDIFRILAYSDNTQVFIDNALITTLNQGETFESYLDEPHFIEASAPILVAQYKKTSQAGTGGNAAKSDPLMLIMPPIDQYGNFYRFANIQSYEYDFVFSHKNDKVYSEHYINIISKNNSLNNINLDGNPVQASMFIPIPNSNYSFASLPVSEGTHEVNCPGGCGLIVYGYGVANSYGYYGGMNLIKYDFTSPKLFANKGCYIINGIATDSTATDSRLIELDFPISDQHNVNITANNTFPASIASYSATLQNHYLDGSFKVRATDSAGLYSELVYDIPGFTLALKDIKESTVVPELIDTIHFGKTRCFDITIENYGKFPHLINYVIIKSATNSDTIPEFINAIIQPGEQRTFPYCIEPSEPGAYYFDVSIEDSCTSRDIAKLILHSLQDLNPPLIKSSYDSCFVNFIYDVYEELKSDVGIKSAKLLEGVNINYEQIELGPNHYQFKINVIDPRQSALFRVEILDSVGNQSIFEVRIPGFTLEFLSSTPNHQIDFGNRRIGGLYLDTLLIYNYGNYTITLDEATLRHNLQFSVPQSQFPLKISPKDTARLVMAYKPVFVKDYFDTDTLLFTLYCIDETIPLIGFAEEFNIDASSKCDVNIRFITDSIPSSLEITLADEYSPGIVQLDINNPKNNNTNIYLYNSFGVLLEKLYSGTLQKGKTTFEIQMHNYSAGLYFIVINNDGGQFSRKFIKIE